MAKKDSTQQVAIADERRRLASEACFEIEQLGKMLRMGVANGSVEDFAVRGVCLRIEELSEIISIALNDEDEELGSLAARIGTTRWSALVK